MSMNFELKIEQSQKLVMTPELHQAITLLQFSALELVGYIQEELASNPLLEIEEREENDGKGEKKGVDNGSGGDENVPFEWEDYFDDTEPYYHRYSFEKADSEAEFPAFEHFVSSQKTLAEHLTFQLQLSAKNEREYAIGEYLIGNLSPCGYLQGDISEHARFLGAGEKEVLAVLELIQTFDPPGVGARNLQECLLLQLKEREHAPSLAEVIIKNYLEEVARGRLREIAHKIGACQKEVQEAVDFIRTLNPKPGSSLGGAEDVRYIVPDVIVEKVEGEYVIVINDNVPHLVISPFYKSLLQQGEESLNSYIKKRLESALWLIKSIEQRRLTLYKVTEWIVSIQKEFLEKGIRYLKPLTLKEVADKIGIHESTVSRATANKYVQTPRGLYPLKFFFSSGIEGAEGEAYSVASIKSHLKELVENEDRASPYSDQKLTELLKERGIQVSRRTVTKYREEMGIPASFKRRRI